MPNDHDPTAEDHMGNSQPGHSLQGGIQCFPDGTEKPDPFATPQSLRDLAEKLGLTVDPSCAEAIQLLQCVAPRGSEGHMLQYRLALIQIAASVCCDTCSEAARVARRALYGRGAIKATLGETEDPFPSATFRTETAARSPFLAFEQTEAGAVKVVVDEGHDGDCASIAVPHDAFEEMAGRFIVAALIALDEKRATDQRNFLHPSEVQE